MAKSAAAVVATPGGAKQTLSPGGAVTATGVGAQGAIRGPFIQLGGLKQPIIAGQLKVSQLLINRTLLLLFFCVV